MLFALRNKYRELMSFNCTPLSLTAEQIKPERFCWYPLHVSLVRKIQRKQNSMDGRLGSPLALKMMANSLLMLAWFIILDMTRMSPVLPGKETLILQSDSVKLRYNVEGTQYRPIVWYYVK